MVESNEQRLLSKYQKVGDKYVASETHSVYDTFYLEPYVVQRGISSLDEATKLAQEYAILHGRKSGSVRVITTRTVVTISRVVSSL